MTEDEQEALSLRYIAPRVLRLRSGNIAIIPMMGDTPTLILGPSEFTFDLIPTTEDLEAQSDTIRAHERRPEGTARQTLPNLKPELDML